MLANIAAPAGCELRLGPALPATGAGGLHSVERQLIGAIASLTTEQPLLLLVASTGAGKSKFLPSMLAKEFGPTYAITPAKVDVKSMAAWATVSCAYQVGGAAVKGAASAMLRIQTAGSSDHVCLCLRTGPGGARMWQVGAKRSVCGPYQQPHSLA